MGTTSLRQRRRLATAGAALFATLITITSHGASSDALFDETRRVLFLGDSITYSGAYVEFIEAYVTTHDPDHKVELINVGLPSETVSGLSEEGHAGGRFPRPDLHERLDRVLAQTKPDWVFACYGMNDGIYLPFDEMRFTRYREGIAWLRKKCEEVGARITLLTPPTFDETRGGKPGYAETLQRYSKWLLEQRERGWDVIDINGPMTAHLEAQRESDPGYFLAGDGVHCGPEGHWIMAQLILAHLGASEVADLHRPEEMFKKVPNGPVMLTLIQQKQRMLKDAWLTATGPQRPGMQPGQPLELARLKANALDVEINSLNGPFPGKRTSWNGFDRYDFEMDQKRVLVVAPEEPAPGNPWVWHGEFFGHKPEPDIALLKEGFHVVYLSVPDMLGSPTAVVHWNTLYDELTGKYGFAKKAALVGLSRGGLYCYNWAIANPGKVACIYADAPVCDFKSWPGGLGAGEGSPRDWALVLSEYGFANEGEALAYEGNPVDRLEPLAKAGVPLLHVFGDADKVVPWEENTGRVAERYRALGGSISLIRKRGVGHHPHGLTDPTPIVEFILKHAQNQ
jgi:pimeloyl-ACP methyl ester carboxylesterase/lysophospholipase L1-like esterase